MREGSPASRSSHRADRGRRRVGLRTYLFCCLGLAAALPVLLLGTLQLPTWEAKQIEEVDRERRFVAETLANGIVQIVDGHVRAVETLAGQVQALGEMDPARLQSMVSSQRTRYGGFSFMYIAGRDGVSLVVDPPFSEEGRPNAGTDYANRDYFKELLKTGQTAISRVQIGKRSGVPNVQIAAPILDRAGKVAGFVEGSLDLNGIEAMAERIVSGIPGLAVAVLDHEGRVIAFPDPGPRNAVANLSRLPLFGKVAGKGMEIRTGDDNHGTLMRASAVALPDFGLDWTVVVYRPQSYEQGQAAVARGQVLTVAGLALLLGLLVATLLSEALARPIRRLADIATAVSHGDFSASPEPPHSLAPREMAALQVEIRHMVGELKDYTENLENKITERTEQVNKANHELEAFMYSVTHDLKSPVVSLYGMAAMLEKKCGDNLDEQGRHYLRRLMSNAGFMEQLITDLLNFSKVGKHEYRMERLDVERVVRETLDHCDSRIRAANVQIEVHRPLPEVVFDHTALCKVFLNLIGNAMKFMGEQPHPKVEIGGCVDGDEVEYHVKDNGIGIDPKYHDQVFKIFQRLKEVSVEGTGIGLAIVKKIVEMSGGRIWFRSTPGQGTTFYFRMPARGRQYQGGGNERERVANG